MSGIGVIAALTCREAMRRKILIAAAVVGAAFLVLYGLGVYWVMRELTIRALMVRREAVLFLATAGMYCVNWLTVLMAILTSVDTLAGEISSGVIQTVAAKPIRRWEIVLGKYIGFAAMLTVFNLVMVEGVRLETWAFAGWEPRQPFIPVTPRSAITLGLMWLESLLLVAVTFRVGASLSTLATGITVFGLHVLAFLGGWIEEFGSLAHSQTAVNIGVIASIIMPSESMWRLAAAGMQGPVIGSFGRTPFSIASVPSPAMVAYAGLYLVAALLLAARRLSQRDL